MARRHIGASAILIGALLGLSSAANAQQLPRSGTINFHTGWRAVGDAVKVAENHTQGHGIVVGTTFNDKGSGPLHQGAAECFYTFFIAEGTGKNKGYCAFSDPDGDRVFTDWHGEIGAEGEHGTNNIVGGTGKYAGIRGGGPWRCKGAGSNGAVHCGQRLDYRLP
jgi:hypothetical protein